MASSSQHQFVLLIFFIITINSILITNTCVYAREQKPPPKAFHIPINRDAKTLQHYATFQLGTPPTNIDTVLDLSGSLLSLACHSHASSTRRRVRCNSSDCQALANPPKCKNDAKKCVVSSLNPFNSLNPALPGELNADVATMHSTNGTAARPETYPVGLAFECVDDPTRLSAGLAGNAAGILGLTSLAVSLASAYNLPPKFALCAPSTTEFGLGDLFVGGGPYKFPSGADASEWLSYTPLSRPGGAYYVSAKSIKVDKRTVGTSHAPSSLRVEISTATRHGVLERSLYSAVVGEFSRRAAARNMTRAASPVAPFGAFFSAAGVRWTRGGPRVPAIDIELEGNMVSVNWRINGGNSMVRAGKNVLCLGFVDGGDKARASIVLGGLQIEDNFLEFDLTTSRLGFTSSILPRGARCSNFRNL